MTPREIKELNNNMNFPYKLISPLEEFDEEGWEKEPGYNAVTYINSRGDYIIFKGFPDLSNSYKLTYLSTYNPEFVLFGIRIGDNITIVDRIMKENGYKRKKTDKDDYEHFKGKICISLGVNITDRVVGVNKTLRGFVISIKSSDWFHKGYYK